MNLKLDGVFLPLGSMVRLKETTNDALTYFVVARAVAKNELKAIVPRYKVAPHPFGDVPNQEIFTIGANQISEVLFEGYQDDDDKEFLESLLHQISSVQNKPNVPSKMIEESINEVVVDKKKELERDPFYKFRK